MELKKITNFIIREIIYNGHLQSVGASSIVYLSGNLIGTDTNLVPILLHVYFLFQFIYANDRYVDVEQDVEDNFHRSNHLKTYFDKIPYFVIGYLLLAAVTIYSFFNIKILVLSLTILVFGYLYPYFFKNLTKIIPTFKNWYVSIVHGLLVFYPLFATGKSLSITTESILLLLFVVFQIMAGQFLLDIKDKKTDQKSKLMTLPVLVGEEYTFNLVVALNYATLIFGTFLYYYFGWTILFLSLISFFITDVSVRYIKKKALRGYLIIASKPIFWLLSLLVYSVI